MSAHHLHSANSWNEGSRKIMEAYRLAEDSLKSYVPEGILPQVDEYFDEDEDLLIWQMDDIPTILRANFLCLLYSRLEHALGFLCDDLKEEFSQKFSHRDTVRGGYILGRIDYVRKMLVPKFPFSPKFNFEPEFRQLAAIRNQVVHACGEFEDLLGSKPTQPMKDVETWIMAHPQLAAVSIAKLRLEPGFVPYVYEFLRNAFGEVYREAVRR